MAYFNYLTTLLVSLNIITITSSFQPSTPTPDPEPKPEPIWIKPYIIDYRNGTIIRDTITEAPSFVPPPNNPHIQSKDIFITNTLRARVFLPTQLDPARNLPILIYFHGGAFCIGSPFSEKDTLFIARLTARSNIITIAIDYRLYPDARIPAPYDDAWTAFKWVTSHKPNGSGPDPWLTHYGDFNKIYAGGDSAGGNIAHNLAVRVGLNRLKLKGLLLAMPYFLGSVRVPLEPITIKDSPNYKLWGYVCSKCKSGVDNVYINPIAPNSSGLGSLGCEKLLVYTAELDELRGRDKVYYEKVKMSGWIGKAKLIEAKGQTHVFHILQPQNPATSTLIDDFSTFLNH